MRVFSECQVESADSGTFTDGTVHGAKDTLCHGYVWMVDEECLDGR